MVAVAEARAYFGLTQSNMAELLNISLSAVKMIESGSRKLTGESKEIFRALASLVNTGTDLSLELTEVMNNKEQQKINTTISQYIIGIMLLLRNQELELTRMEDNYIQVVNRYKLLLWLAKKTEIAVDKTLLKALMLKTKQELQNNSPAKRELLKMKIDINKYSLRKARQLEATMKAAQ